MAAMGWRAPSGHLPAKPWTLHARRTLAEARPWVTLHEDTVTRPDGTRGPYVWIETPDLVRVLLLLPDGTVPTVQQWHYLTGPAWQLPGGAVDPDRDRDPVLGQPDPHTAALRELREETGIVPPELVRLAVWEPLPGLTKGRVHTYLGRGVLRLEQHDRDDAEADLTVVRVPLAEAAQAAIDGRMRCAASAATVLAAAACLVPTVKTPPQR